MKAIISVLLTTLALATAGLLPIGQSSVSVQHVGKDFAYRIEETHGLGLNSASLVLQPMSIVPVMADIPANSPVKSEVVGSVQDEKIAEMPLVDQSSQGDSLNAMQQPVATMVDSKMTPDLSPMEKSVEAGMKDSVQPRGKQIVYNPLMVTEGHPNLKTHNGFQYFQLPQYYYPVRMVRMV